jgi:hypothetical protein
MTDNKTTPLGEQRNFSSNPKAIHNKQDLQWQTTPVVFEITTARLDTPSWPEWKGAYFLNCSVKITPSEDG